MLLVVPSRSHSMALCGALALAGCSSDTKVSSGVRDGGTDSGANSGGSGGNGGASSTGSGGTSTDGGKVLPEPCAPDESAPVPANRCSPDGGSGTKCGAWIPVTLPGAVCSDGSPYKIFVKYSNTSNNLAVEFEPGGACWDYESCSGNGGIRGAANPHGIQDDHMAQYQYLNLLASSDQNPVKDYNMVFVSYCTGDVHTGDKVATYTSSGPVDGGTGDGGTDTITFHHNGHKNTLAVVDWMRKTFGTVPKMLVTGCSAGGAGAIINYHFIRKGMGSNVQCSYLLDDSGPIFHSDGPSNQLDTNVRSAWNVDPILDGLDGELPVSIPALKQDFGLMNLAVAQAYPHDRLSLALYRMDFNYSLYSYQRFFPGSTEASIHAMWWQDIQGLIKTYDAVPNLAYFIPYFRSDNCSHCVSIPPIGNPPLEPLDTVKALTTPWVGSEIQQDKLDLKQFTIDLLDDKKPFRSYLESVQPTEDFTPAVANQCMQGG